MIVTYCSHKATNVVQTGNMFEWDDVLGAQCYSVQALSIKEETDEEGNVIEKYKLINLDTRSYLEKPRVYFTDDEMSELEGNKLFIVAYTKHPHQPLPNGEVTSDRKDLELHVKSGMYKTLALT